MARGTTLNVEPAEQEFTERDLLYACQKAQADIRYQENEENEYIY